MEFKGTKGKWERVKLEKTDFYTERNEIHYGKDGEMIAEFVHDDHDAQLISKAPEMLEMLLEIRNQIEDGRTYITKEDINQLVKEATTFNQQQP